MPFTKFGSYWDRVFNAPETALTKTRMCDVEGCSNRGDYRAPKSRDQLKDYYWFCLDHVREYNSNWDYFKGMSSEQIEDQLRKSMVGDRPSWRATRAGFNEERIKEKAYHRFTSSESVFEELHLNGKTQAEFLMGEEVPQTAIDALETMGLEHPVTWDVVKARYKSLAKQHHPDRNSGSKDAEEMLKNINLAYSLLKISYKKFTTLEA